MKPRIYDKDMNLIGVLQNASEVGYTHKFNDLYTAKFKLPIQDPKNSLCETYNIVDIFDGDESKGKYRILEEPDSDVTAQSAFIEYSLEHVITFLINDVIDGYLELGGYNFRTRAVLEHILGLQSVERWQLGDCDFDRRFQYSWENTSLMDALFSIPTCFDEDYHWEYDTSSYPWTIHLRRTSTDRSCEIRRKRNMRFIKRHIDGSKLCTRLYCKGYGEGVNQLTVADVNDGLPYIQDNDAVAKYGVLSSHWIDRRFTHPETLYARGLAILNELKNPAISYTASAVDLSKITGQDWDRFDEGKGVHVIDEERNIDIDAMIIEVEKPDVDGKPLETSVTICNKSSDIAVDLEEIARRASITAQYSQGATNLYAQQCTDNADEDHPAELRFFIPTECARINQVILSYRLSPFRAYERSIEAGGGSTVTSDDGDSESVTSTSGYVIVGTTEDGGSSVITTKDGGDSTATTEDGGSSTQTTTDGGGDTRTTTDGGYTSTSTASGGSTSVTTATRTSSSNLSVAGPLNSSSGAEMNYTNSGGPTSTDAAGRHWHTLESPSVTTSSEPAHSHGIDTHSHYFRHYHTGAVTITIPELDVNIPEHAHNFIVPYHSHNVTILDHYHSVNIPKHSHSVNLPKHSHSVNLPKHSHSVNLPEHSHSVNLPKHSHGVYIPYHTHDIEFGIYSGGTATGVSIIVDDNEVPSSALDNGEIDVVTYLATDGGGKITRGTWHTIEIVPDGLTRIEAFLFVKAFITSYAGGNY